MCSSCIRTCTRDLGLLLRVLMLKRVLAPLLVLQVLFLQQDMYKDGIGMYWNVYVTIQ